MSTFPIVLYMYKFTVKSKGCVFKGGHIFISWWVEFAGVPTVYLIGNITHERYAKLKMWSFSKLNLELI